jgi:hypothetical protein
LGAVAALLNAVTTGVVARMKADETGATKNNSHDGKPDNAQHTKTPSLQQKTPTKSSTAPSTSAGELPSTPRQRLNAACALDAELQAELASPSMSRAGEFTRMTIPACGGTTATGKLSPSARALRREPFIYSYFVTGRRVRDGLGRVGSTYYVSRFL